MGLTEHAKINIIIYNSMLVILLKLYYCNEPVTFNKSHYDGNFKDIIIVMQEMQDLFPGVHYSISKDHSSVKLEIDRQYKKSLDETLCLYFYRLIQDNLQSDSIEVYDWKTLNKNFNESLEGKIVSSYNNTNLLYIPIIFFESLKGTIKVKDVQLWLNKDCDKSGSSRVFKTDDCVLSSWNDDFIKCVVKIDATDYIAQFKTNTKSKKKIKTVTRKETFSPQQQRMYNFILECIRKYKFEIRKEEFNRFMLDDDTDSNGLNNCINRAINKLNKQYQEIYNINSKIIVFDKATCLYEIQMNDLLDEESDE